jgi:hypothetical protein
VTIKSENDCICNNQQSNCVVEGSMRTDSVEAHEESVFLGEIRDFLLFFYLFRCRCRCLWSVLRRLYVIFWRCIDR